MRAAKTTKEIQNEELEQLKRPEARETAAFDPTELQGLIAQTREDDLAVPVAASSAPAMPILQPMPTNDWDDVPGHYSEVPSTTSPSASSPMRMARGSAKTPKASRPIAPSSSTSLLPWIVVALAVAVVIALAFWH